MLKIFLDVQKIFLYLQKKNPGSEGKENNFSLPLKVNKKTLAGVLIRAVEHHCKIR